MYIIIACLSLNIISRYLGDCLHEHTNCYTLEVSFFCYTDKETGDHIPYTQEGCKSIINIIIIE